MSNLNALLFSIDKLNLEQVSEWLVRRTLSKSKLGWGLLVDPQKFLGSVVGLIRFLT